MSSHDVRDAQHSQHYSSTSSTASVSGDEHAQSPIDHNAQHTHMAATETRLPMISSSSSIASKSTTSPSEATDFHPLPLDASSGEHSQAARAVQPTIGALQTTGSLNALLASTDASLAVPPTDVPSRSTTPVSGMRRYRNRNAAANPGASLM